MFCSQSKRRQYEQKGAALDALRLTLKEIPSPADPSTPGEEYLAIFKKHYPEDAKRFPDDKLAKALKRLAEHKKREKFERKLDEKSVWINKKLAKSSASVNSKASGDSSSTLVESDSEDEALKKKGAYDDEGAPLELKWTWSALGEAF